MMWEFLGKLLAVTVAVNFTVTWTLLVANGMRKNRNPWPDRENLR